MLHCTPLHAVRRTTLVHDISTWLHMSDPGMCSEGKVGAVLLTWVAILWQCQILFFCALGARPQCSVVFLCGSSRESKSRPCSQQHWGLVTKR